MTEEKKKVAYICDRCWNDCIGFDASVDWSVEKQEFIIDDVRDSEYCSNCDSDCRSETREVDANHEIIWPSVAEVIEEADPLHIVAMARICSEKAEPTMTRDIHMLYDAVIETNSFNEMIDFAAVHPQCDHLRVEEQLIKADAYDSIKTYMEKVDRHSKPQMLDAVITIASKKREPAILESIIVLNASVTPYMRKHHLGLRAEEIDRVRAVYKLLGGNNARCG